MFRVIGTVILGISVGWVIAELLIAVPDSRRIACDIGVLSCDPIAVQGHVS